MKKKDKIRKNIMRIIIIGNRDKNPDPDLVTGNYRIRIQDLQSEQVSARIVSYKYPNR